MIRAIAVFAACAAATPSQEVEYLDVPCAPGALGAELSAHDGEVILSWLEPSQGEEARGHVLRFSRLVDGAWSEPRTVVARSDFFANWADFPSVVLGRDGVLLAHWLQRSGSATYAYDVQLARSTDAGVSWQALGKLHGDATKTEHGFVSIVPEGDGFHAVWLDGRETAEGGAMALRAAAIGDEIGPEVVLDDDVCTCCQTDLVRVGAGLAAVYRDHAEGEIRDISIALLSDSEWRAPSSVHDDGWRMPGCPVNGPSMAATEDGLWVAWYTAAAASPRVLVAHSADGGATFGPPRVVDAAEPVGRAGVAAIGEDAAVSWLAADGSVSVRRVTRDGMGPTRALATTGASRKSGFPRIASAGHTCVVVWRETEGDPRLRSALVVAAALSGSTDGGR